MHKAFCYAYCLIKGPAIVGPRGKFLYSGSHMAGRQCWEHLSYIECRKNFQTSILKRANLALLGPISGGQEGEHPAALVLLASLPVIVLRTSFPVIDLYVVWNWFNRQAMVEVRLTSFVMN